MEGEGILGGCKVKKEVLEMRKKELHEKPLHLPILRKADKVRSQEHWNKLNIGICKKQTERMLMVAQVKALKTINIKSKINEQCFTLYRLYIEQVETISHVMAERKCLCRSSSACGNMMGSA